MPLNKSDFYFGALLSRLVKTGAVPAIIESGQSRSIYSLSNVYGEYKIYAKYLSKPTRVNKNSLRWDFNFTESEVQEIKRLENENKVNNLFGFVCTKETMKDSEIMLLTYDQLRTCFGKGYQSPSRRVSVILEQGSWNFSIYGTGLDRTYQALKITRDVEKRLNEIGFAKV